MYIFLIMCLNDVIGDTYYTSEIKAQEKVKELNDQYGGDFWYKTMRKHEV